MKKIYYKVFKTSFGYACLIFDKNKIHQFILPLPDKKLCYSKIPPDITKCSLKISWLSKLLKDIKKYFKGQKIDFKKYEIELSYYTHKEALVLKKLRDIKYGETTTYKKLAELCNIKNGARFIGNVMAKNKTPVIIPCHRVIKSNKSIGNFSYGSLYKLKLLRLEKIL